MEIFSTNSLFIKGPFMSRKEIIVLLLAVPILAALMGQMPTLSGKQSGIFSMTFPANNPPPAPPPYVSIGPPVFEWTPSAGAATYDIQFSTDPLFSSLVHSATVPASATTYILPAGTTLPYATTIYWQVVAVTAIGARLVAQNAPFEFTTHTNCAVRFTRSPSANSDLTTSVPLRDGLIALGGSYREGGTYYPLVAIVDENTIATRDRKSTRLNSSH